MLRQVLSIAACLAIFPILACLPSWATEDVGLRGTLHDSPEAEIAIALPPDLPRVAVKSILKPAEAAASSKRFYVAVASHEARAQGLPPEVAAAVIHLESRSTAEKVGGVGEVGIMQVRPATAALLGFQGGHQQLSVPETNIRLGVTYLARAWRLASGDLCGALMRYRAGHSSKKMSPFSVEYCRRARLYLADIGSPLAFAPLPRADTKGRKPSGFAIAPLQLSERALKPVLFSQ